MRSGCSSIDTSLHWQASLDLSYKMARARFRRELTCTYCTVLLMWLNLICLSLIMWFSGRFRQKRIRRAPVGLLPPFLPVMVFMAFTTSFSSTKWCKMSCLRSLPCLYVKKAKQWQGPTCPNFAQWSADWCTGCWCRQVSNFSKRSLPWSSANGSFHNFW